MISGDTASSQESSRRPPSSPPTMNRRSQNLIHDAETSLGYPGIDGQAQPGIHCLTSHELQSVLARGFESTQLPAFIEAWVRDEVRKLMPQSYSTSNGLGNPSPQTISPMNQQEGPLLRDQDRFQGREMHQDMQEMKNRMDMICTTLQDLSRARHDSRQKDENLHHQISVLKEQNHQLTEKANSLRNALIITAKPQVIDSDVSHQFLLLRNSITNMVRSNFENEFQQSHPNVDEPPFFRDFRTGQLDMKYLLNRVRSQVFLFIHEKILSRSFYPGRIGRAMEWVEQNFLEKVQNGRMDLKDFVEWRWTSIDCTQKLYKSRCEESSREISKTHQGGCPEFVYDLADQLWLSFSPLKLKKGSTEEKGIKFSRKACEEAYKLTELMRRARDVFYVVVENDPRHQGHMFPSLKMLVDEESSECPISDKQHGPVAYWTFGALTKRTEEDPEVIHVMEKGSVVVYSRT
ncbi:hypothetical protein F4825DRAFT_445363 [Nemania diffusa]|nr:hypothetical protein F4825DRAFT_445363 [Nemania diffusa]